MLANCTNEDARLAALDRFDILDTPREESFDRITRLARKALNVPIAHISFIDAHRQWLKSAEGIGATEVPREQTFCRRVIESGQAIIVPDASQDPRFADSPFVRGEPGIRFYVGIPLKTPEGHDIGTMCAIDTAPRAVSADEVQAMNDLVGVVMRELTLRQLAFTDGLTGVLSRRAFREQASRSVKLAFRHHNHISCILGDIDHFKAVNDRFGHAVGDAVLSRAAAAWVSTLRATDLIGRMGGEEFAVLLPHTEAPAALEVAEKLRTAVAGLTIETTSEPVSVTASLGVASLSRTAPDFDALLHQADKALYEAKAGGRNRSVLYQPPAQAEAIRSRRRVLKGGRILFNDRGSSIDCTVRSLSDDGAGIDVSSTIGVPKVFDLAIAADGIERTCRTMSRTERHLEVEFC